MSKASALREQATAKLAEAHDLTIEGENGTREVPAENEERFNALMGEFHALDKQVADAQTTDDNLGTLPERMSYYTGKVTGTPMRFQRTTLDPNAGKSMGQQFVESAAYKQLAESGALRSESSKFRSDPVVVGRSIGSGSGFGAAATDVIQTETGGPGAGLVTPFFLPGAVPLPQRPLTIRDLFPVEDMTSGDQISYAVQTGFDNAAAAVAQATTAANGAKPQSSVAWQRRTDDAEYIATWMAATRQALADPSQMRSLIDNQGRLMIQLEEEDQLVNGDGTTPNISGILDRSGIQTLDLTGEDNLDGIRDARRLVKTGLSRLDPTFIILNPADSMEFDLLKDLEGRYRAGDPFGNGPINTPIWRLQRVESEAVTEGTAIVGARAAATIWERQPLTVLTADQHADFFVRNLVVVLFEERIALQVIFPTAFVDVTLDPDFDAATT